MAKGFPTLIDGHLPPALRVAAITEAAADRLAIILGKPVSDPESIGAVETVDESVLTHRTEP